MTGGLHFTPEQIRTLPLAMQVKIGLGIAEQLAKAPPVADQEKPERREADAQMRPEGICKVPVQRYLHQSGTDGF